MAERSFGEDFRNEMAGKAVMWGPAIAGALLLGNPVGILLGLVASVSIVASGSHGNSSPPDGDQGTK
jgi:hypothetical protein